MVSDLAERDAAPVNPSGEQQIIEGPSDIPLLRAAGSKSKRNLRNQVPVQPVKPLFVAPDPVPIGAVVSSAQLPSSMKESRAVQPASAQAISLTLQHTPSNGVSGPPASNAHLDNMGVPQVPALIQAVDRAAQSVKHQSVLRVPAGVPSPVGPPGYRQVPPGPKPINAPSPRASPGASPGASTPYFPYRPSKHAPNSISTHTPLHSAPLVSHNVDSYFSDKNIVQKQAFSAGYLLPSKIAPKPLLSIPTPVPPRPVIRTMAHRPAAVHAQLASAAPSRPVNPPRTDAATPHQQDACKPSVPHSKPASLQPQTPANGTVVPAKSPAPPQVNVTVYNKEVHPGHKHTAPVYVPRAQKPDQQPVTQMLAQVYADQGDDPAPDPPQVKQQCTGGSSRPLEHQLSIDVLLPPDSGAASAAPNTNPPASEVLPVQRPDADLANPARAMLSLKRVGLPPGPAAVSALEQKPQLRSAISAGAAAAQAPAPSPAAAVEALLRHASLPLHATAGVAAAHMAQGHVGPRLHSDLQGQAQLALAQASHGRALPHAPSLPRKEHNPAAAIAEQARATAGKHVHPQLKLGSAPAGALASLVRQISANAMRPALCQPTAANAAAHTLAAARIVEPMVPIVSPQVLSAAVAGPSTVPYDGDTEACESAGSFVPQIPSPGRSTASHTVKVTVKHLLDTGFLKAGEDVLKCGSEEDAELATLRTDGSIQLGDAAACSLTDLPKFMNGTSNELDMDDDVWHYVTYKGHPLQHYKRLYISHLGAASASPQKRRLQATEMQTPFLWKLFDQVHEQKPAKAEEDCDGDIVMVECDAEEPHDEDGTAIQSSPPQKRARRQATTVVSYAKLASEGLPESKDVRKASARSSQQGEGTTIPEPCDVLCPVVDKDAPVEHMLCKPLDVSLLQGVARFAHLQPASPRAASPLPIIPLTVPSNLAAPAQPTSKRSPNAAKPPAPSAALHSHSACPAATAAVAAVGAGVGVLQALDKMSKLPPVPRKLKSVNAALPTAPKPAPSTTAACAAQDSAQRSRRESRAPARASGVSGLTHTMMQLEAYTRPAGDPGADSQPFSVDIHPVVLAVMDIHAHLCQNEIIGVLGGHYDAKQGRLVILKSLSVREGVLDVGKTDVEMDPADQSRAIEELRQEGLQCVGWYHSHPTFPVWPSAIDVYNQNIQQVARSHQAANDGAIPYIAAIVGPYDQKNATSQCCMSWFYVENKRSADFSLDTDPEVCLQHMVPKALSTNLLEKADLPVSNIIDSAAELIEQYAGYSSRTELRSFWRGDMTCLQKLVSSVFHSLRGFLDADALKELGTSITTCALKHFYGVQPPTPVTTSKRVAARMGR